MGKHKSSFQTHHLYLGVGGMLSVAALVIALTFGLSSAEEGMMMNTAEMQSACTSAGGTWDGTMCQMPATNTTPPQNCTSDQYWNGSSCVTNPTTTTTDMQSACTSAGGTWDGTACQMSNTNTTPSQNCTSDQYWNGSSCVTGVPPVYGDCRLNASQSSCTAQPGCRWFTVSGSSYCEGDNYTPPASDATQSACTAAGGTWNSANTPPCTMPTTATTCITPGYVTCPSLSNRCVTTTDCGNATPVCAAGQTPSSATPCRASADTTTTTTQTPTTSPTMSQEEMQRACASAGGTWNSTNTPPCTMPTATTTTPTYSYTVRCPALNNREVNPSECEAATPYCAEGTFSSMENPCKMRNTMTSTQMGGDMMQCPNKYNPGGPPMFLPKEYRKWDPATRQETVTPMNSCADWDAKMREDESKMGMGGTRPGPMPATTPAGQITGTIDCSRDFRNPFCRSGTLTDETRFKDVVKDTKNFIGDVKLGDNLAYEVRTLKLEAVVKDPNNPVECNQTFSTAAPSAGMPSFVRPAECDIVDAERQMMDIALEAGISCPVSGSIQEVIDKVKPDFDFIRGLTGKSSVEQITEGRARLQRAREALQALIGSWDPDTETSTPGLMQGLNTCRDIGFLTRDAERMLEQLQYLSATDEYKELASFAENPLAYLPSGVDIFAPWQPDPDECVADESLIFGGDDGGIPGPKNGRKLEPKHFGRNAVLLNPAEEEFDEEFDTEFEEDFTEEEMMPEPGVRGGVRGGMGGGDQCGFFEPDPSFMPKAACMPPAMRYLGMQFGVLHDLAKALAEQGCASESQSKGRFACEGFKQAPQELAKNGSKLPKEVRDIVDGFITEGTQFCSDGDDESAERVFRAMMQTVMPFMRDKGMRTTFGNTKKQVIDQMKERGILGENDKKSIAALEKEIGLLSDQLAAMEVKYQELLVAKVALQQQLGKVAEAVKSLNLTSEHIARLQGNDTTSQIGRRLGDVNKKHMSLVSSIIELLPRGADACKRNLAEALDATFTGLSTEGNRTVDQMLDGLYAKVSSGALTAEEVVKACEGVKDRFVALAGSESEAKAARQEGVIAFSDTPLNHWTGSFALIAARNNLATTTNESVGVGNNEMYAQAIVRAVRLGAMADPDKMGDKLGDYLALDAGERDAIVLEKDIPGLSEAKWARPFVAVCQEFDVQECLTPPVRSLTDTISRAQMAGLLVHVLEAAGLSMPSIADIETPPDSTGHSYLNEIKVVKAWGIMGVCGSAGGSNFCPDQSMNVGMDLVAAVNTSNYIQSVRALKEAAGETRE